MATRPADPEVMTRRVRYGNRLEAFLAEPARAGQHPTMILLHEIIEILGLADNNGCLKSLIVVRNGCRIRAALIDGDFFWEPLGANRLV